MRHTTTLGIRRMEISRYVLNREIRPVATEYGEVRVKYASGMGTQKAKPEYEDIAAVARKNGVPVRTVREAVQKAIRK